jgi:hypothetical protein
LAVATSSNESASADGARGSAEDLTGLNEIAVRDGSVNEGRGIAIA